MIDKKKLKKIFDFGDIVLWIKSFVFGIRVFIVIGIIAAIIYGIGYYKAIQNRPVVPVDISSYLADGKEVRVRLNGDYLKISHNCWQVEDENGKLIKIIEVKDIPILAQKLAPIGLFVPNLIGFYGICADSNIHGCYGGGIEFVKLWNVRLGGILTNDGGYVSASYPLNKLFIIPLTNTNVTVGTGYSYKGDRSNIFGLRVKF